VFPITAKTAEGMRVNMCTEYEFVPLPDLRKLQKALASALDADEWVDQWWRRQLEQQEKE
jgi:hypothetical protein